MSVKLYVEGGGDSKSLKRACRRGFGKFLERAGAAGRMPRIVACGSRRDAYESFEAAHASQDGDAMLLVDAEATVTSQGPWQHLKVRDGWERPEGATDEQCHLMVQVMESWFLADADTLSSFYDQGFRKASDLPQNPRCRRCLEARRPRGPGTGYARYRQGYLQQGGGQLRCTGEAGPRERSGAHRPLRSA